MRFYICILFLLIGTSGFAQIPDGYYDNADGKSGDELKTALYNIIKGHTEYAYTSSSTDTWDILKEADKDPNNSANVIGIYSGFSMDGAAEYNSAQGWSREHVWAKSRGDFGTSKGAGTDCHHIVAKDVSTNSARSNRNFDECSDPYTDNAGNYIGATDSFTSSTEFLWKPRAEVKGDVARMLSYMATRYEGESGEPDLELTEILQANESKEPFHAKLSVLLTWHEEDPVSPKELDRNEVIYGYQNNRNPFIDHPEYNECIWGAGCNEDESKITLSVNSLPHFGSTPTWEGSSIQSYVLTAENITEDVIVTSTPDFRISLNQINYGLQKTISLSDALNGKEIYVQFFPTSGISQDYTAEIIHESGSAFESVSVSGTEISNPFESEISIIGLNKTYTGEPISAIVQTSPSYLEYDITYDGERISPIDVGSYEVEVTIQENTHFGSAVGTLIIGAADAEFSFRHTEFEYDGNPKEIEVLTDPEPLNVIVTYDGNFNAPTNAGTYSVYAVVDDPNGSGSATTTMIINQAEADFDITDINQNYDGTSKSVSVNTTPEGLNYTVTYNGSEIPPKNVGTYSVTATIINESNHFGSQNTQLTIIPITALIQVGNTEHDYDGSPKEVTVETDPQGLNTIVLYDDSETAPTEVGTYTVDVSIDEEGYVGSASTTMNINEVITGLSDDLIDEFLVYPNPVSNVLSIESNERSIVKLINNKGHVVFEGVGDKEININGYQKGVYLLTVDDSIQKVIVE